MEQLPQALLLPGEQLGPGGGEISGDRVHFQPGLAGLLPEREEVVGEFYALEIGGDAEMVPGWGVEAGVKSEGPLLLLEQRKGGDKELLLELLQRHQAQAGQLPIPLQQAPGGMAAGLTRKEQQGLTAAPLCRVQKGFIEADITETEGKHGVSDLLMGARDGVNLRT
ncbi:MAG: hypothetical protein BWY77_01357 [bacterium ADurb.Bin431]|nr:MAG: hypothetical protein BWY77_01357 [bacterium ADurb.Bin431]